MSEAPSASEGGEKDDPDAGETGAEGSSEPDEANNTDGPAERHRGDPNPGSEREGERSSNRELNDRKPDDREPERSGRALLRVVFVGAVLLAGGFGYFIGAIGPQALGPIGAFGVTVFRPTPTGMALYGMTVTGLVLGTLYVGARLALRREGTENGPSEDR